MARLIYVNDQGGQAIELGSHQGLGRHPNNAIQLLDTIASKEHCILERQGHGMVLRDLGSMNGTYINGQRMSGSQLLHHGDEIRMGNTVVRFDDGFTPFHFALPPVCPGIALHVAPAGMATPPAGMPQAPGWNVKKRTATAMEVPQFDHLVNVDDSARAIGVQVQAQSKEFMSFDEASRDPAALRLDYERLRITWELLREIGLERDVDALMSKILDALFRFVAADRGVILLKEADGTLNARAHRRRDGQNVAINLSSTILKHVTTQRAGVLTHDAGSDFAASGGKSMFLNRISSAIVVPLLHDKEVIGALWLDSEKLASFKAKDLELPSSSSPPSAIRSRC
jgi:adenylate cyclase